jgi:hypothetical protein
MTSLNFWTGTFSSKTYNYFGLKFVQGTIDVALPQDLTQADTDALLAYTGIYRRHATARLLFKYSHPTLVGTFTDSAQVIEFTPMSICKNKIQGEYVSKNPYDVGTFTLNLIRSEFIKM